MYNTEVLQIIHAALEHVKDERIEQLILESNWNDVVLTIVDKDGDKYIFHSDDVCTKWAEG